MTQAGQPDNPYAFPSHDVSHIQATQAIGKCSHGLDVTRDLGKGSMGHGVKGWAVWRVRERRAGVRASHCAARSKQNHILHVSRREEYTVTDREATQSCR